jgi:hypothetical protein
MSIEVHRKLRLEPIERKQPQRPLLAKHLARWLTSRRIVARKKEAPPCPPR